MKSIYIIRAVIAFCICSFNSYAQETNGGLPVRISSFNISNQAREIKLKWTVACGLPMAYFEIQRSANGKDFTSIHQFSADRLRCQSPFEYIDQTAANENYYRIRVGDADGNFTHEKILHISSKLISTTSFGIINPVQGSYVLLNFVAEKPTEIQLRLVSINGRQIEKTKLNIPGGYSSNSWYIPNVQPGIYFVEFSNNENAARGFSRFLKLW